MKPPKCLTSAVPIWSSSSFRRGEKNSHSGEGSGRLGKQPGTTESWRPDSKPDSPAHPAETQGKEKRTPRFRGRPWMDMDKVVFASVILLTRNKSIIGDFTQRIFGI